VKEAEENLLDQKLENVSALLEKKLFPLKKKILTPFFQPQPHGSVNIEVIRGKPSVGKVLELVFIEDFWNCLHEGVCEALDKHKFPSNERYSKKSYCVEVEPSN
jgi:hypothetical protein